MCGIAGIFDPGRKLGDLQEKTARMLKATDHRGPDNSSVFVSGPMALGHNRLSIIDLQSHSHQPMERDQFTLTFNGEIYNYREIRLTLQQRGYTFTTESDTEVILNAYKEWGENCVEHFMGMWSFAIWDSKNQRLFCSRDRFGIKPFYYIDRNGVFAFASEIKALKTLPIFSNEINEQQVYRGLQLGWTQYAEETYYLFVNSIPAGTNMVLEGPTKRIYKYWDLTTRPAPISSDNEQEDEFRRLFLDSVRLHSNSDVNVGACLSGGLDSSAIVASYCKLFPEKKIKTFTIYYDGNDQVDERPWVNHVLAAFPQQIESYCYKPSNNDIPDLFLKTQQACEVPLTGSSPVSQHLLMKVAAENGVKVLLDGQGSDEYLAGYMHTFDRLFGQMIRKKQLWEAARGILTHSKAHGLSFNKTVYLGLKSMLASFNDEQKMLSMAYRNLPAGIVIPNKENIPFRLSSKQECDQLSQFLYDLVFTTSLPTLLHYEDRNSMHYSIESRVPFLDHRLVEYAFNLPAESKIRNGETKYILRKSLRDILPAPIANRQDKKGFVTPGESSWLKGPLKELLDVDFRNADFIDNRKALAMINGYKSNKGSTQATWRLATLSHWLKTA